MGINNNVTNVGAFIPTTNVWDVSEIGNLENVSEDLKELLLRLYQNLNLMAINVNLKDTGIYYNQEFVNGQAFFPNPALNSGTMMAPSQRQVYRTVINFGQLSTNSVAHNLTFNAGFTMTRLYGCSSKSDGTEFVPIPYASNTSTNTIELYVDNTNVNIITTNATYTGYTVTYIVMEYIKN